MKKVVLGFVSAAALATVSTVAMAGGMTSTAASDQSFSSNPAGFIVSGNLGYGKVDYNAATIGFPSSYLSGFAWNANLGYQINSYLAFEGGYTQFHSINTRFLFGGSYSNTVDGVDLLAKAIYPINEQFNVFAKAGAMDMFSKTSVNGITATDRSRIVPEFGVGTSYNVTSNVALTLQGITTLAVKGPQNGTGTMPATYTALAGVSYKFNV